MQKNRKRKLDLSGYVPVGMDWERKKDNFEIWLMVAALFAMCSFMLQLVSALNVVYDYHGWSGRVLVSGAVMPDFYTTMDFVMLGYQAVGLYMLKAAYDNYGYHRQDSMSIYLMRRLPDRWELHRRCLGLPLMGVGLCVLAGLVTVVVCYGCYMVSAPQECLAPHQWEMYWRLL